MILKRFYNDPLAQASYLVGCEHARVALIVDPNRDISQYIEAAAAEKLRIIGVTETHIHADFVSGSRELAARTGATLYLSDCGDADWKYRFAHDSNAELLTDGSQFMIGDVQVEVMHTPGHTPEHIVFLLTDTAVGSTPMGALTGDFVFVGDVGRPDLLERAAGMAGTMEAGARRLFQSLQEFKKLPDFLQLWPGHGAGSACGKALGAMPQSTLGYERLFNWAVAESDEEQFVRSVLEGQPEPPRYFAKMKAMNRDGVADAPTRELAIASPQQISDALAKGETVIDTRTAAEFATSHAAGSLNIPRNKSFLNWTGALAPYDQDIWFIANSDDASRNDLSRDLSLIGLERIAGVLPPDRVGELAALGVKMKQVADASVADTARNGATIVDVRGRGEYAHGHIPGALNIPLVELEKRASEIPSGKVIVHCQAGGRAAIAASVLQRLTGNGVSKFGGGFEEWERSGNPVERGGVPDTE